MHEVFIQFAQESTFQSAYTPVSTLLYFMGVLIALLSIAVMLYLRWWSDHIYSDAVYGFYSFIGILFFLFSSGGAYFDFLVPGAIWVSGLMLVGIVFGAVTGYIIFGNDDLLRLRREPEPGSEPPDSES